MPDGSRDNSIDGIEPAPTRAAASESIETRVDAGMIAREVSTRIRTRHTRPIAPQVAIDTRAADTRAIARAKARGSENRDQFVRMRRPCRIPAVLIAAFVGLGLACALPIAQAGDERSFVIRAGRVMPVSPELPWVIEPGVIIVRDGRIEFVGTGVELPPDLRVIDLPDATIVPGFVSAANDLVGDRGGDESIGAGYRAIDWYDEYADHRATISFGVTTVHLSPGRDRLVSGQGAVVKLGGPRIERLLNGRADVTVNFSERAYDPPNDMTFQTPASS
ncbi:MAG: hypothetical protein IID36_08505, partial [Planctomycetes bacterium]|nr:hypothetical protein [Planctomycetota bacterium]